MKGKWTISDEVRKILIEDSKCFVELLRRKGLTDSQITRPFLMRPDCAKRWGVTCFPKKHIFVPLYIACLNTQHMPDGSIADTPFAEVIFHPIFNINHPYAYFWKHLNGGREIQSAYQIFGDYKYMTWDAFLELYWEHRKSSGLFIGIR